MISKIILKKTSKIFFKKYFFILFCLINLFVFFTIHYKFAEKEVVLKKLIASIEVTRNYNLLAEAEISYLLNPDILEKKINSNYKIPTHSEIFFIE